jgi:hypothetical protein
VQTAIMRPRLYGAIHEPASAEEIETVVSSAVALFLARYGTPADR